MFRAAPTSVVPGTVPDLGLWVDVEEGALLVVARVWGGQRLAFLVL